jgi:hypothetical protein
VPAFGFEFEPVFRPALALVGVTPWTARIDVTDDDLRVRFGPWSLTTPRSNVAAVTRSGPYHWYRAIGARYSFSDGGVTFGTTTRAGVCVTFYDPVPGLLPFSLIRHRGMTVTPKDVDGFVAAVQD